MEDYLFVVKEQFIFQNFIKYIVWQLTKRETRVSYEQRADGLSSTRCSFSPSN